MPKGPRVLREFKVQPEHKASRVLLGLKERRESQARLDQLAPLDPLALKAQRVRTLYSQELRARLERRALLVLKEPQALWA